MSGARAGFWRAFWRLAKPYWSSEDRWRAGALLGLLIVLTLAQVWVSVRLNTWQGAFYDSLVLSGAIVLHHAGKATSLADAAAQIRTVLDSGRAAKRVK